MSWRMALFTSVVAGCAPASRAPCMDASTPLEETSVPLVVSTEGPAYELKGPVLSVGPAKDGRQTIEVAGGGPASARQVAFSMPSGQPLPFRVGDVLEVRVRSQAVSVFAGDRALEVRDAGGRLLAMEFGSAAAPEDWSAGERSSGRECLVVVRHGDACAFVPTSTWRRLQTPDGAWAIHATCAGAPEVGGRARPGHAPGPTVVQVTRLAQ